MKRVREFCFAHHITALWQAPMADYTTFRIGGKAEAFLLPPSEGSLVLLLRFLREERIPFCVIGNGSNLLVTDECVSCVVISTRHIRSVTVNGTSITVGCGTPLSALCRRLSECSLGGAEALYGIPGTVGGAVYMNAGAYDTEISDLVRFVSVVDTTTGSCEVLSREDCRFSYRHSVFMQRKDTVILSVELSFFPRREESVRENMKHYLSLRMEKQPTALPSAGSAFRRPQGGYASRLVAEAGLSGFSVGGAAVSVKHSGFLVNLGDATARDVIALLKIIREKVQNSFGVCLTPEIEYLDQNGTIRDPLLGEDT